MDTSGGLIGELIETGQNTASKAVNSTVSDTVSSVRDQLGLNVNPNTMLQDKANVGQRVPEGARPQISDNTAEIVSEFYAPSDDTQAQTPLTQDDVYVQQQLAKDREEIQKLSKVKQDRHDEEYFVPLQQQSVPHEKPIPQEQSAGPEVAEKKPMSELGTLGSIETRGADNNKPFALAARRAMTNTEMRGSSPG